MSKKQKTAIQKFEPSTGDESYLVDAPEQWVMVNKLWSQARSSAYAAISTFIEMGELLVKLRDQFPGDNEFGKARKQYAPELSRNDAHRAMNMARNRDRFLIAPDKPTPSLSVFAELVNASDELVEEVITQTEETGKSPTVKEVRQKVKAEKPEPQTAEDFESEVSEKEDTVPDVEQEPEQPTLLEFMDMTAKARIKKLGKGPLDTERAHIIVGINPYYDGDQPMTLDLWTLIRHDYMNRIEADEFSDADAKRIEAALDFIDETIY